MNREEFKQIILSQFKQENAPIHTLMLNATMRKGQYELKKLFTAKEFGFIIHVETLDDESGQFQVLFQGKEDSDKEKVNYMLDITGPELINQLYVKEDIVFENDKIRFCMKMFNLEEKDYVYKNNADDFEAFDIIYDISKGKFIGGGTPDGFVSMCNESRSAGHWNYIDFSVGPKTVKKLIDVLNANNIHIEKQKTLVDLFTTDKFKIHESVLAQIVHNLS